MANDSKKNKRDNFDVSSVDLGMEDDSSLKKQPLKKLSLKKLSTEDGLKSDESFKDHLDVAKVKNSTPNNEVINESNALNIDAKDAEKDSQDNYSNNNFVSSFGKELNDSVQENVLKSIVPNAVIPTIAIEKTDNEPNSHLASYSERHAELQSTKVKSNQNSEKFTNKVDFTVSETKNVRGDDVSEALYKNKVLNTGVNTLEEKKIVIQETAKVNKDNKEDGLAQQNKGLERIEKMLNGIAVLLSPFKDVLVKTLPSIKPVINFLDKLGIMLANFIRWMARKAPIFFRVLKSNYVKAVVIAVIALFLLGTLISRAINSREYVEALESAIYDNTGYKVAINGVIRVRVFPLPGISMKNVTFYVDSLKSGSFKMSQFSSDNLVITFKILPLFIGTFRVDKIEMNQALIDIAVKRDDAIPNEINNYQDIIRKIENLIDFKTIKVVSTDNKALPTGLDEGSQKVLNKLEEAINIGQPNDNNVNEINKEIIAVEEVAGNQTNLVAEEKPTEAIINQNDTTNTTNINENTLSENPISNKPNKTGSGFAYNLFSTIVNLLAFDFKNVESISINRGKINLVADDNSRILSIDNIEGTFNANFFKGMKSSGTFRFMESNIDYKMDIEYHNKDIKFNWQLTFLDNGNDGLIIQGTKLENNGVEAKISSLGKGDLILINKFLFPIDLKNENTNSFNADLIISNGKIEIKNMDFKVGDNDYKGSFIWDLGGKEHFASLDVDVKAKSLDAYFAQYNFFKNNLAANKNSSFLPVVEALNLWKTKYINNFKTKYFHLNIRVNDSLINSQQLNTLETSLLFDNEQRLYLDKGSFLFNDVNIELKGKVDLENKKSLLLFNSNGSFKEFYKIFNLSEQNLSFIEQVAGGVDNYNLSSKIAIDGSKYIFNDIVGVLGKRVVANTYGVYLERVAGSDLLLETKIPNLDAAEISSIYNYQVNSALANNPEAPDLFGISKNLNINLNIVADRFSYNGIKFNEAILETTLSQRGISIKKFEGKGEHGGNMVASFVADSNVVPTVAGHLNLENFVLKLEDTKKIIFKGKNVIGDIYLNGRIRFSGDSYQNPFTKVEGEVTFVKYERVRLNRFANINGLYLTVSEKKQGNVINFLVNDAYGRVTIKDSKVEFYPVVMLYIYNNKEYRGTFDGEFNFFNHNIKLNGVVDGAENISNQMTFSIAGNILNPEYKRNFIKNKQSNRAVKPTPVDLGLPAYKSSDLAKKTADKDSFAKTYNTNQPTEEKYLTEGLYEDSLDVSLYDNKEEELSFKNSYPKREGAPQEEESSATNK